VGGGAARGGAYPWMNPVRRTAAGTSSAVSGASVGAMTGSISGAHLGEVLDERADDREAIGPGRAPGGGLQQRGGDQPRRRPRRKRHPQQRQVGRGERVFDRGRLAQAGVALQHRHRARVYGAGGARCRDPLELRPLLSPLPG